ncbi:MAG TPA: mechanosensitive ion channel family protein [Thermomonas sp.]|mgnify:FL=1|jgi:small conductance mechanosensitive channel|uniref:mechanosensitive ion channel family protein n=1 Tax=Thermomonas sp. TaxID=1971895 RepID=UPI002B751F80|nr:mechanosensitive ion channel family protein [Thermomonas sp.]HOZ23249.1 mechanosensitive ion channel family protein [Thermomonas sp.]HPW12697.1 mechanosensitive ion channel family protein [Thermomonas sp.]
MPILDPDKLPTASSLGERFMQALEQVQDKLLHLVASAPLLLVALLIVLFASWLGGFASRHLRVVKRFSSSNPYMEGLLRSTVRIVITLAGVVVALDLLNATSLVGAVLGSAGVIGLVLGFGFKDIAENYIAGVLLSLRKPFSPGDTVRIDSFEGKVVALTARATILMTVDGNHLQLPNSVVFKSVLLNYSRNPKRRFDFETVVDNRASWHAAMDAGLAAIGSVEGVLAEPPPSTLIRTLSNDGATLQFAGWIDQRHNDLAKTRSEAMRRVRRELREAGFVPPEHVQKVILQRGEADFPQAQENGHARDTSVDRALDAQVGNARRLEDGGDLLRPPPPGSPPT